MKLIVKDLRKAYDGVHVLDGLNLELEGPGIYCLMAPSGSGKTTLFRLILGLEEPDWGTVSYGGAPALDGGTPALDGGAPALDGGASALDGGASALDGGTPSFNSGSFASEGRRPLFSAVFQENRLFEHLNPVENLKLALGKTYSREELVKELLRLLPCESLDRPVFTMSGGMKRRLAFVRAMLALSDLVLLDEPFTGLDEATKELVICYLLEHLNQRLFIIATHNREDAKKLGASLITLQG